MLVIIQPMNALEINRPVRSPRVPSGPPSPSSLQPYLQFYTTLSTLPEISQRQPHPFPFISLWFWLPLLSLPHLSQSNPRSPPTTAEQATAVALLHESTPPHCCNWNSSCSHHSASKEGATTTKLRRRCPAAPTVGNHRATGYRCAPRKPHGNTVGNGDSVLLHMDNVADTTLVFLQHGWCCKRALLQPRKIKTSQLFCNKTFVAKRLQ